MFSTYIHNIYSDRRGQDVKIQYYDGYSCSLSLQHIQTHRLLSEHVFHASRENFVARGFPILRVFSLAISITSRNHARTCTLNHLSYDALPTC